MNRETLYIFKRRSIAALQSLLFYMFRILPMRQKKIVFCCIEGTTGFSCNPKYIAKELIRRNEDYELVWLVNDMTKQFPAEIRKVRNTLWNRAYELTTAHVWIDNSRKQLEVRKRKGQIYIQTWHAKLGFKPTCLDRGKSFSQIAYLVSKHDSEMVDYWLSNSEWYDHTLPTGSLYTGTILRTGSPRCDILINGRDSAHDMVRKKYHLPEDARIIMYAPTFRGGSQGTDRSISSVNTGLDYEGLMSALEERFCCEWYILLRVHPQLVARNLDCDQTKGRVIDVSRADDMYELLAGCDAFLTDYSSAAFDAAVMRIPVFLYCSDYREYEQERGSFLWNMRDLPFPMAEDNNQLKHVIKQYDKKKYHIRLKQLFLDTTLNESGKASEEIAYLLKCIIQ